MSIVSQIHLDEPRSGVTLHIELRHGTNIGQTTLVFLHFWGGSTRTWSRLVPLLSPRYTTVALDFRGWGKSQGTSDPNAYSTSHLAEDVEAVVAHLRLDKVVLVGLSMGAKVAQIVAGLGTLKAVEGLVLISPAPATPLILPPEASEQQVHAYETWPNAEFAARNVLVSSPQSLDDSTFQQIIEDMLTGNEHARAAWPLYAMSEDFGYLATRIRVPALVIAAEADVVEPLDRVKKEVCDIIPGSELAVIPNSGHLSPLEAPDAVSRHMLSFLERFQSIGKHGQAPN